MFFAFTKNTLQTNDNLLFNCVCERWSGSILPWSYFLKCKCAKGGFQGSCGGEKKNIQRPTKAKHHWNNLFRDLLAEIPPRRSSHGRSLHVTHTHTPHKHNASIKLKEVQVTWERACNKFQTPKYCSHELIKKKAPKDCLSELQRIERL